MSTGRSGVTVIDRTGPVPVEGELSDAEIERITSAQPTGGYNLADLDDDGNLK